MEDRTAVIDWSYMGEPDFLVGTGATRGEKGLTAVAGLASALLYVYFYAIRAYDWSALQFLIAGLIALDVGGGVVANSLNSCKRFYHTPARPDESRAVRWAKNSLLFSALHVHTLLVALLYGGNPWLYGLLWYALLVGSTFILPRSPLYLQRPLAMLLVLGALLANFYLLPAVTGFEWLVPALFLKIVYGHGVREEPYRPLPGG